MKQALICASFGTTVANGRKDLEVVEQALQTVAPDRPFCRAWTSRIIRKRMAARGESVDGLPEALEKLAAAGYDRVAVQPTHLSGSTLAVPWTISRASNRQAWTQSPNPAQP